MTVKILDTTLRDGSYVVDFQFDADDTTAIVTELSRAGVPYIEVGHGLGLGASRRREMRAAVTDQEYLSATAMAAGNSRWGVFFIPGIGELDDIRHAARSGMSFIRIGTDITDVSRAERYVNLARSLGLEVFCNFMKTYAVKPNVTAKLAKVAVSMGASHICVVDSAGGMLPNEVAAHVTAIKSENEISVGFHGHNNLGLAIANGLSAVEAGATIVDTSMRGMGRSAGNASTEIFALALRRAGHDMQLDVHHLLDTAERIVDPLLRRYQQIDSVGVISGYAQFHSSFTEKVGRIAEQFEVDIRDLIIELTKINQLSAPDDLLQSLATQLSFQSSKTRSRAGLTLAKPSYGDAGPQNASLVEVLSRCQSIAKKWKKKSVLNLVCSESYGTAAASVAVEVSPYIFEGSEYVVASAIFNSERQLHDAVVASEGCVESILLDQDKVNEQVVRSLIASIDMSNGQKMFTYSDTEVWSRAAVRMSRTIRDSSEQKDIVVVGDSLLAQLILNHLRLYSQKSESFVALKNPLNASSKIVLLCSIPETAFLSTLSDSIIVDVRLNSLSQEQIEDLSVRGNQVLRLEMHRELHAEIQAQVDSIDRYLETRTSADLFGIRVVSNGVIGQSGDVVLDSVNNPTKVIGVADGRGLLKPLEQYTLRDFDGVHKIREYIVSAFRQT